MGLVTRGAVSPASRGTASWAGNLALDAVGDFVSTLAPQSAAARLINAGMKVSLAGKNSVKVPRRNAAPATTVAWVPEAGPIPVKQYSLDAVTLGPACKLATSCVMTREMVVHASGQQTISTLLREDLSATLDSVMFGSAAAVAGTNPAGLTNGLVALTAATGGDTEAMLKDLGKLAGVIADGGGGSVVYIMATRQALAAKVRLLAQGIEVWPSVALAAGTIVAVCPDAFVSSIDPEPIIDARNDGAVQLADPAAAGLLTTAPVSSLFQGDLIAVRAMVDAAFCMRASNMVAVITGATWGA